MTTGNDLISELSSKVVLLDKAVTALGNRGRVKAEAERKYSIAFAEFILRERDKGTAVTIIEKLGKGDKQIAQLKFERDIAETAYDAALEAINSYKLQIRILNEQISREWNR